MVHNSSNISMRHVGMRFGYFGEMTVSFPRCIYLCRTNAEKSGFLFLLPLKFQVTQVRSAMTRQGPISRIFIRSQDRTLLTTWMISCTVTCGLYKQLFWIVVVIRTRQA